MIAIARPLMFAGCLLVPALPASAVSPISPPTTGSAVATYVPVQLGITHRPSQYSNGYGTNAANSYPVTPVTPYGGYVVNQYGYGNYVSGPLGYGGYPAGSPGAQIWRQREEWKCQNVPESC